MSDNYQLRKELKAYEFKKSIRKGRATKEEHPTFSKGISKMISFMQKSIKGGPKYEVSTKSKGIYIGLADAMAEQGDIGYALGLYKTVGVANTSYVQKKIKKNMPKASEYQLKLATEINKKLGQ